ncbi:MAG: hypothetical protein HDR18_12585 [Lachnospiraceae bacterium]|nr:hypothetical protein [Lachnospiraceae bacterium]
MKSRRSMQRRRRWISLVLAAVMCLSGCGGKGEAVDVEQAEEADVSATEPEVTEVAAVAEPEVTEETQEAVVTEPSEPEEADEPEESEDAEAEEDEPEEKEAWDPDSATADESWITFGSYEQDNDLTNGAEPIEWRILKEEEGRILLLSRYGLDAQFYNDTDEDVTWETCTLREWLNGEFYNTAFDEEEKNLIESTYIETADNPDAYPNTMGGNPTVDLLFLLSGEEAEEYLQLYATVQATEYAMAKGGYTGNNNMARAWLRSPGGAQNGAQIITAKGTVDTAGDYNSLICNAVCPAMWVTKTPEISAQVKASDIQIGTTIFFGHYEQNEMLDGPEQLAWTVLDVKDGKMLLFCEDVFEKRRFGSVSTWMNNEFYNTTFSSEEKKYIVLTLIKPSLSGTYDFIDTELRPTESHVFALNSDEATRYLMGGSDDVSCWLRDESTKSGQAIYFIDNSIVRADMASERAIRPAIWVETEVLQSGLTDEETKRLGSIDSVMTVIDEDENCVTFGRYEQDNDLENGPEPIEWFIIDREDDKLLLISKYGLDAKKYHEGDDISYEYPGQSSYMSWDQCTIRKWLNDGFYNTAFNEDEQGFISLTELSIPTKTPEDIITVKDYVFLLSCDEAKQYFEWDDRLHAEPTAYTVSQAYTAYLNNRTAKGEPNPSVVEEIATTESGRWLARDRKVNELICYETAWTTRKPDKGMYSIRPVIWVSVNK